MIKKGDIVICKICNKEFIARWNGKKGNIVCSEECRRESTRQANRGNGGFVKCTYCGKEFWRSKSRLNKAKKHYCSLECRKKDYPPKVKHICKCCGKEYETRKSISENSKYCSQKCKQLNERNRVETECTICGKKIFRIPSWIKKSKAMLCSKECYNKYFLERVCFYQSRCDTKPELMFDEQTPDFINKTSDCKYFVNFKNGKIKNPDFIVRPVNKTRKVIEIFGRYWHKEDEVEILTKLYEEVGYKVLILWEDEVYNETYHEKLKIFLEN